MVDRAKLSELQDRVKQVLEEIRVVIPGTEALLGFQLTSIFSETFQRLDMFLKSAHFASLCLITLCTILLMMPAAYHRIVENGHDSESFHAFASRSLVIAMAVLAFGISLDLFVVGTIVFRDSDIGVIVLVISLILFLGLWFGYSLIKRHEKNNR